MKVWGWLAVILVMAGLHQDFWLWTDKRLVFGFLPAGLAYHVFYSIMASVMLLLLVRFAWPSHLEELEAHDSVASGEKKNS
jgi:hypothetical protein